MNLAAIPSELVESTLFGHEKGAFTGAVRQQLGQVRAGRRRHAVPRRDRRPAARPAGRSCCAPSRKARSSASAAARPIKTDFRLICATNQDLERAVREGRFRDDLYYRINVVPIEVPALRRAHRRRAGAGRSSSSSATARRFRKPLPAISDEALARAAALLVAGQRPRAAEPDRAARRDARGRGHRGGRPAATSYHVASPQRPARAACSTRRSTTFERNFILRALEQSDGNVTATARALGVPLSTLKHRMLRLEVRDLAAPHPPVATGLAPRGVDASLAGDVRLPIRGSDCPRDLRPSDAATVSRDSTEPRAPAAHALTTAPRTRPRSRIGRGRPPARRAQVFPACVRLHYGGSGTSLASAGLERPASSGMRLATRWASTSGSPVRQLGRSDRSRARLVPSRFTVSCPVPARDEVFLLHTLTDAQAVVSADVYRRASTGGAGAHREDDAALDDARRTLAELGFLVASREDDDRALDAYFADVRDDARRTARHGADDDALQLRLRLLRAGRPRESTPAHMTLETADDVSRLDRRAARRGAPARLVMTFFGGEPLLNLPVVERVARPARGSVPRARRRDRARSSSPTASCSRAGSSTASCRSACAA